VKTDELSSKSSKDAVQASRMSVLHYHAGYGRVSLRRRLKFVVSVGSEQGQLGELLIGRRTGGRTGTSVVLCHLTASWTPLAREINMKMYKRRLCVKSVLCRVRLKT